MNKGLVGSVGAIVLGGAMAHIGMPHANSSGGGASSHPRAVISETAPGKEGPWIASCKYWAESRLADVTDKKESPELHITLNETNKKFDAQIKGSTDSSKGGCENQDDA